MNATTEPIQEALALVKEALAELQRNPPEPKDLPSIIALAAECQNHASELHLRSARAAGEIIGRECQHAR
jgi:hypothetical protein